MRTRTHVIQIVVVSTALVVAISLAGIDVSAIRYFRSDTIVRDAWDPSSIPSPPYFDPAPWAIWSSSDLFVHDVLRAGALPLWDRLQGGGYSPVVVVQNGVFHPLRWAVALVPRDQALSTLVLLIIAFSFLGMWLVLRCGYDTSVAAAYTGAVFYTLSGAFLSFLHFSGASIPLLHLPWLAFALICAQRSRKLTGGVILAAGMALLFLSGHPLLIIAVLVALSGVACGEAWDAGSSRPLALLFVCGAAGALLAAFAILPPLAALDDLWSYKTGSHFGSVYAPFYPWSEWFRAVGAIVADPGRQYFDDTRFAVSAGAGAAALALVGAFTGLVHRRGAGIFLLLVGTGLLAIPTPSMAQIAALRPLTYMNRWYFSGAFAFFVAIAAATGFDVLRRQGGLVRALAILLGLVTVAESAHRGWRVIAPARRDEVVRGNVVRFLRGDRDHFRVTGFVGGVHLPNCSRMTGIEDVRLSSPLLPLRSHLWWLAIDPTNRRFVFPTMRVTDRVDAALFADFNVKYVLQSRLPTVGGMQSVPGRRDAHLSPNIQRLPLLLRAPSIEVRAIPGVKPRAHFAARAVTVPDVHAAVRLLARNRQLARETAVVESQPLQLPSSAHGEVAVRYPGDSHVVLDVRSPTGGIVVLHDSFDRGWRARLDGKRVQVLPVNILSRGVVVPPGRHTVTMDYVPPGFAAGVGISGLTLLALIAVAFRSVEHRSARRPREEIPPAGAAGRGGCVRMPAGSKELAGPAHG